MNCRDRHHQIVLFLYDELNDAQQAEFRAHLAGCTECQEFVERERHLHSELSADFEEWNMPPELLVECRRTLSDELDRLEARRSWWKPPVWASGMRWLEGAALVSLGLALGVYVSTQQTPPDAPMATAIFPENAAVSNLRIVDADPLSGEVELEGQVVSPISLQGRLEDENVQELLFSALSAANAGERLRTVELLAANARDRVVQDALIGSLLHDENPGVRLYALQGLKPFSAENEVRTALLYALENDANPGIRVEAIDALTPLTQDEAMEEVVQEAVRADPNAYVRMRALQYVGR